MADRAAQLAALREERRRWQTAHPILFGELLLLFYTYDPMRICSRGNPDSSQEYEPEVGTILPRLRQGSSVEDVEQIIYEEFQRWFGSAIKRDAVYQELSTEIVKLLQQYKELEPPNWH